MAYSCDFYKDKVDHFKVKLRLPLVYHLGGVDCGEDDGNGNGEVPIPAHTSPYQPIPTNTNPYQPKPIHTNPTWQKKTMDKRCILRHFKPFCKSCFLTLIPPSPPPYHSAMGGGSTQPLPNITNPYQSKTCLDKAPRALKKFVVGWGGGWSVWL